VGSIRVGPVLSADGSVLAVGGADYSQKQANAKVCGCSRAPHLGSGRSGAAFLPMSSPVRAGDGTRDNGGSLPVGPTGNWIHQSEAAEAPTRCLKLVRLLRCCPHVRAMHSQLLGAGIRIRIHARSANLL
jgi:hypothetical protein